MKDAPPDWFETSVARLTASGTQRVWSVVVTIFGDLAQGRDDQISGALIAKLTRLAGIKAEATRVALHRLRKDGWIESTRVGRNSVHRLTEFGRTQSAAAAPRIYAREVAVPDIWHLLVADSSDVSRQELAELLLTGDYISLNSSTAMAPGLAPTGAGELLVVEGNKVYVPSWLRERCGSPELSEAYNQLLKTLRAVKAQLPTGAVYDPVQVAVLRVLVVHYWRRLVLRHPDLPEPFLPKGWSGPKCRETVHQLLDQLPRPSLAALEDALTA